MIAVELELADSELRLNVPAEEVSLPVIRQALRSLGEAYGAPVEDLEDAELAVTEACANVVEHAYPDGDGGAVEVTLCPSESGIEVSVRDRGRGMPPPGAHDEQGRGFGLAMIEGIARTLAVRSNGGTELAMDFALNSGPHRPPAAGPELGADPSERILRRLVAVVAAQADMPTDRMIEALLVAELVARHGLRHLVGGCLQVGLERVAGGLRLRVGPLEAGGADAVVAASDVPVVGPVIARLADELETEVVDAEEHLVVGFYARQPEAA